MTSSVREQEPVWKRVYNNIDYNQAAREGGGLATEVAAGLALDAKTAPWLAAGPGGIAAYIGANALGGATANIAAQKLRGEEQINWGEVISSGALGIIPFTSLRFGYRPSRILGRAGTIRRAATGGAGMGVADRYIQSGFNEGELPSTQEVIGGGIAGGVLGGAFQSIPKIIDKYKFKKPSEINSTILAEELDTLNELQKQLEDPEVFLNPERRYNIGEEINRAQFDFDKSQGKHPGFIDYDHWKLHTEKLRGSLYNSIDGQDPFYTPLVNLRKFGGEEGKKVEKFLRNYEKRETANFQVKGILDQAVAAGKKVDSAAMRRVAGFIHVEDITYPSGKIEPGLRSIARQEGKTILDVHKYLKIQDEDSKLMDVLIQKLNEFESKKRVSLINEMFKIDEYFASPKFNPSSALSRRWARFKRYAEKYRKYEKGHKQALWQLFINELTGGNRVSNTFAQTKYSWNYTTFDGKKIKVKGNRALGARNDLPLYSLMQIRGSSKDLADDFRKTIMPIEYPRTSVSEDYQDLTEILYRNKMENVGKEWKPTSPEYDARVSAQSTAITDGLFQMMKAADDLDIPYWVMEDLLLLKIPIKELWPALDKATQEQLGGDPSVFVSNWNNIILPAYKETRKNTLKQILQ
tara:strand:- start:47 stop:1954 length:1908 start_codon:yes stop_codon:yes gene_type:complete